MKTLKLDHALAQLVETGAVTATWRLYDDKDLSINDTVQLIDKVDPQKPETWRVIGTAHVDSIIQKRLGAVEPSDYEGYRQYPSQANMLETYQRYYGPQVTAQTAVKIIRFTFNNKLHEPERTDDKNTTKITEVKLYGDGGSRGNPGPSASGFVVMDMGGQIVVKKGIYLGITTNNQAEYQSLKLGLEEARQIGARTVHVYMDSLLVINQMRGIFKVKNRDLWPIYAAIKEIAAGFKQVTFTHVPRELNKLADAAVNETLDEVAKRP
jgi:ribonuclease HI